MGVGLRPVITIDSSEIDLLDDYDYKFIKGDNQKLVIDNFNEYTFTINGDYSLFESLKIGGQYLIIDEDYTVTEGSTIITFTKKGIAKLNNLSKGEYEILVNYSNGKEVKGKLIMNQSIDSELDNPETGDNFSLYLGICIISVLGLGTGLYSLSKKT